MNIALSAILLLLLILPGFVFLKAFERTENTSIERRPFDVSSASALLIAVIIHFALLLATPISGYHVDFSLFLKFLLGAEFSPEELEVVVNSRTLIATYFLVSMILPYLLGKISQKVVFYFNPYKGSLLSFETPWYYELKGKISRDTDQEYIKFSCVQEIDGNAYIYFGVLEEFYLTRDGQLDRIVLSDASLRRFEPKKQESKNIHQFEGSRLILKYSEIKNLNIEFYQITREEPEPNTTD